MAKSTKSKNTRTARRRKPAVYSCTTCGKVTKHLCSPIKAKKVYVCQYCGVSSGDPRHVCAPMVAEMKYACKQCGRVTPFRGAVCQPRVIR
jgi:DNA-directed RNA polymerase subunit RPC12/RpoP